MRTLLFIGLLAITFSCNSSGGTTDSNNSVNETFDRNSQTVREYLEAWQNKDVDYANFIARDFVAYGTAFNQSDTTDLEDMIASDESFFANFSASLVDDPLNLLPGVSLETKMPDGSVRYYADWEITKLATDSTEAKTGVIKLYQAYTFNDRGKINMVLTYGDFSGLWQYMDE